MKNKFFLKNNQIIIGVSMIICLMSLAILLNLKEAWAKPEPPKYTITANAGAGGTINPSGSISVEAGKDKSFEITPNPNYIVSDVLVDGISQGKINEYIFNNVNSDHTISASFEGGWSAPSHHSSDKVKDPGNILSSDNKYAEFNSNQDYEILGNFNLSIPNGANINGIEVAIEGYRTNNIRTFNVALSWNNGTSWSDSKSNIDLLDTSEKTIIIGGPNDKWGQHNWAPNDFNNGSFVVKINSNTSSGNANFKIDQVQVKIYYSVSSTGSISGQKFNDLNLNWAKDSNDLGLFGWVIKLYNAINYPWTFVGSTTTDQNGNYLFNNLSDGTYAVCEVLQQKWFQVFPTQGPNCSNEGSRAHYITITNGESYTDKDFGNVQAGQLIVHKTTYPSDNQTEFSITVHNNFGWENTKEITGGNSVSWDLYPGTYHVSENVPQGWIQTSNNCTNLQIEANQTIECTIENSKLASITITKYANPDGEFNISIEGPNDYSYQQTFNNEEYVELSGLIPGQYTISENVPEGWSGLQNITCGNNSGINSLSFDLSPGESISCILNNTQYGVISGQKFNDKTANGIKDEDDDIISGQTIKLYTWDSENGNWQIANTIQTDNNGNYSFGNLLPGKYKICESNNGWVQSYPVNGAVCDNEETIGYEVEISAGETITNKDFGNWTYGSISGIKFNDLDYDGLGPNEGDIDDTPIEGWEIELYQEIENGWNKISSVSTAEDGSYFFSGLTPGLNYKIQEALQDGWIKTMPSDTDYYIIAPMLSNWNIVKKDFGNYKKVVISNESQQNTTENSVTITWNTDKPSTSRIVYDTISHPELGEAPNYGYAFSTEETDADPMVTEHSVTLTGLSPNTTYYYRIISHASPESISEEYNLSTLALNSNSNNVGSRSGSFSGSFITFINNNETTTFFSTSSTSSNEEIILIKEEDQNKQKFDTNPTTTKQNNVEENNIEQDNISIENIQQTNENSILPTINSGSENQKDNRKFLAFTYETLKDWWWIILLIFIIPLFWFIRRLFK